MRLTMVGTGYVGLVTGVCFANTGNDVVCLDIDPAKIAKLRDGVCPIYEPGLTELMLRNAEAGRLHYTTNKDEAYRDADMVFICVGTPSDDRGHTDMKYVNAAADDIADVLKALGPRQRPKVVVLKSTVPVGTTLAVRDRIRARVGPDIPFSVADNPEFLKEGDAINDFLKPDRVVVGVEDDRTAELFRELYDPFVRNGHPVYIMDVRSSEMVKYAANNFLATKISFINEMANLCEAYGADINAVRQGMCSDKRIGSAFLYPGLGYGGSCFPKDTQACIMMGEKAGTPTPLSKAVHDVNQRQRDVFFSKMLKHFDADNRGGLTGKTIAFWGLAFKPRTDDIREAPALYMIDALTKAGATVTAFDPEGANNVKKLIGDRINYAKDEYEALKGADSLIICTEWSLFRTPDFAQLESELKERTIFDGRNLYELDEMKAKGFHYVSIGRNVVTAAHSPKANTKATAKA